MIRISSSTSFELSCTANQFWAAVDDGIKPQRPGAEPEPPPPGETIPFDLARNLVMKAGLTQIELARMTKGEAVARWQEFLTSGGSNGLGV